MPPPAHRGPAATADGSVAGAIMGWVHPLEKGWLGGLVSAIAIDGPVASGKTAVGRSLARRLGFRSLDTGIMYRAVTWLALERGVGVDDEAALGVLAEEYPLQLAGPEGDRVEIGGYSLGPELRACAVNAQVSRVSRVPAVRRALVRRQRLLAAEGNIVMMGRDIGTVVLPGADLKVFLSASPEERAGRRWKELQAQGRQVEFHQVLEEAKARDHLDSHRADSPLTPAHDAFVLDTDELGLEQVVERILDRIHKLSETAGA